MRNLIRESLRKKLFEQPLPSITQQLKNELTKFTYGDYDVTLKLPSGEEKHISATNDNDNITFNKVDEASTLGKMAIFCTLVAGLVSCQKKENKEIYGYSVKTHYTQYNLKSPNKNKKITLVTPTGIKVVSADSTAKTEESSPTGTVGFLKEPTNEELEIFKFATAITQEKNRIVSPNYANDFEAKNVDIYPVDFYSTNPNSYFTDIKYSTDFKKGVDFGKQNPAEFERQTGLSASILNKY
jgi:hypothetical protein